MSTLQGCILHERGSQHNAPLRMSLRARAYFGSKHLDLWWDKGKVWWPTIITSNSTHLHYFPSLLWNSGHITPQAYTLKSTEFRDLPPGIGDKGRAEGLPNFRYGESVAPDLCGCHLTYSWDLDLLWRPGAEAWRSAIPSLDVVRWIPWNISRIQLLKNSPKKEPIITNIDRTI